MKGAITNGRTLMGRVTPDTKFYVSGTGMNRSAYVLKHGNIIAFHICDEDGIVYTRTSKRIALPGDVDFLAKNTLPVCYNQFEEVLDVYQGFHLELLSESNGR